jgi:hypothetical protein
MFVAFAPPPLRRLAGQRFTASGYSKAGYRHGGKPTAACSTECSPAPGAAARCLAPVITLYAVTLATFRHSDVIAFTSQANAL